MTALLSCMARRACITLLKKSVKRKIRYHVQRLPAADYGFPGHDNPRSGPGQAGTEKIPEKS